MARLSESPAVDRIYQFDQLDVCSPLHTRACSLPCGCARRRGGTTQEEGGQASGWAEKEHNGRVLFIHDVSCSNVDVETFYFMVMRLVAASASVTFPRLRFFSVQEDFFYLLYFVFDDR
jgi:hypothetical protein